MAVHSTVFALISPLKMGSAAVLCLSTFIGMSVVGALPEGREHYRDDIADLDELFMFFNSLLSFLLALYVSRAVERWWEMRIACIGALWDTIDRLSMWAAAWWGRGTPEDTAARALVLRYGLLSHALLFKEARGELSEAQDPRKAGLEDLMSQQLLKECEALALAPLPCKANVVWAWQTTFWSQALSKPSSTSKSRPTLTPVPHSEFLIPMVMTTCAKARDSISAGLTHVSTQQPFAYTHLLAISVWVAIILNGLLAGLKLAYIGPKLEVGGFAWPRPESWPLYLACAARLVIMPVIYDGLLAMGAQLENRKRTYVDDPNPARAQHVHSVSHCRSHRTLLIRVNGVRRVVCYKLMHSTWTEALLFAPRSFPHRSRLPCRPVRA